MKFIAAAAVAVALAVPALAPASTPTAGSPEATGHAASVVVPKLRCRRLDVAEDILRSRGLRYKEVGGGLFGVVVKSNWRVIRQSPAAGSRVRRGKTVKLYVGRSC